MKSAFPRRLLLAYFRYSVLAFADRNQMIYLKKMGCNWSAGHRRKREKTVPKQKIGALFYEACRGPILPGFRKGISLQATVRLNFCIGLQIRCSGHELFCVRSVERRGKRLKPQ